MTLSLKQELEEFIKTGDRQALVQGLRDQFIANRHIAASGMEVARQNATDILLTRMPSMSDSMLLRTIEMLARTSEKDMEAIFGVGGRPSPMFSFVQNVAQPPGGQPPTAAGQGSPTGTPIRQTGQVLEAIEHLSNFFSAKKDQKLIEGNVTDAEPVE